MTKSVRCIHCGIKTRVVYTSVRSKVRQSLVVLNKAPMHYCSNCKDNLISLEALSALRYIKTLPLKPGINEFDFDSVFAKSSSIGGAG